LERLELLERLEQVGLRWCWAAWTFGTIGTGFSIMVERLEQVHSCAAL